MAVFKTYPEHFVFWPMIIFWRFSCVKPKWAAEPFREMNNNRHMLISSKVADLTRTQLLKSQLQKNVMREGIWKKTTRLSKPYETCHLKLVILFLIIYFYTKHVVPQFIVTISRLTSCLATNSSLKRMQLLMSTITGSFSIFSQKTKTMELQELTNKSGMMPFDLVIHSIDYRWCEGQ